MIFAPDSIPTRKLSQRAKPHQGFGPSNIDDILDSLTDQLDTLYPWWEFRMTELAPIGRTAKFVFEYCGYRAPKVVTTLKDALPELVNEGVVVTEVPNDPATV